MSLKEQEARYVDLPDIRREHHWYLQFISQLLFDYSPPKPCQQNLTIQEKSIWRADVQIIMSQHDKSNNAMLVPYIWSLAQYTKALHTSPSLIAGCWKSLWLLRSLESCKRPYWLLALTKFLERPLQILSIISKSPAIWTAAAQILFRMCSVLVLIQRIISITLPQDIMGYHNE